MYGGACPDDRLECVVGGEGNFNPPGISGEALIKIFDAPLGGIKLFAGAEQNLREHACALVGVAQGQAVDNNYPLSVLIFENA